MSYGRDRDINLVRNLERTEMMAVHTMGFDFNESGHTNVSYNNDVGWDSSEFLFLENQVLDSCLIF